ncbi:MAG: GTP-binding protein [Bacteroidales bacterium]|nr:GTP-binding protein [Bacteroidales bacterium]
MAGNFVPVLLLTGYLGSGKTTLVNRILSNKKGIKFAVIVNDIGEVNIDADLIQKGGVVDTKDDSLVALQNGCICCTLKMDLIEQINTLVKMHTFDYIVIEASGICEPAPIAQTICSIPTLGPIYNEDGTAFLDCIVTVVDALRLQSEFTCGEQLTSDNIGEEDIENLIIQQIEFCNIILLNKASEVSPQELGRIKAIVRGLQPKAEIIECDYGEVDLDKILSTGMFDFEKAATSAAWVQEIEKPLTEEEKEGARELHYEHDHEHHHEYDDHGHHHHHDDEDEHDDHEHEDDHSHHHGHHHHHHHHDEGEAEEYGIGTYVYYRRRPFDINKFDWFVDKRWDRSIIRAKGVCWFSQDYDMSYLFESAGVQKQLTEAGRWFATAPAEELVRLLDQEPGLMRDWDENVGDRMQKIVFIGQHLDKEKIAADLDSCLV